MECIGKKAIFLALKSYYLEDIDNNFIYKHKDFAKNHVNEEWFQSQYEDLSRIIELTVERHFHINWRSLKIEIIDSFGNLGYKMGTKRVPVFDNNNYWVRHST